MTKCTYIPTPPCVQVRLKSLIFSTYQNWTKILRLFDELWFENIAYPQVSNDITLFSMSLMPQSALVKFLMKRSSLVLDWVYHPYQGQTH